MSDKESKYNRKRKLRISRADLQVIIISAGTALAANVLLRVLGIVGN